MKKNLAFVAALVVACGIIPAHAQLSSIVKWQGKCPSGSYFSVCSIDPPAPNASGSCYTSHNQNYIPNDLQLDVIGMCQAAKSATIASHKKRLDAIEGLNGWILRTEAQAQANPNALITVPLANKFPEDIDNIYADLKIYKSNPTESNWNLLSSDLLQLSQDASIIG